MTLRTQSHLALRLIFHAVWCHAALIVVAAVVAAAFDCCIAQALASMREEVRTGTQLDGTVVAVVVRDGICADPPLCRGTSQRQIWIVY